MRKPKIVREVEDFTKTEECVQGRQYLVLVTPEEKAEFDAYARENFFVNTASTSTEFNNFQLGGVRFKLQVQNNLRFVTDVIPVEA